MCGDGMGAGLSRMRQATAALPPAGWLRVLLRVPWGMKENLALGIWM